MGRFDILIVQTINSSLEMQDDSPICPTKLSPIYQRFRETETQSRLLLQKKQYPRLLPLTERLEHLLAQFYCVRHGAPSQIHLQKAYDRDQITLMHNRAVVYLRLQSPQMASEVLLRAIEKVNSLIGGEQMRLGYMDQEEELLQQNQALQSIKDWQFQLARLYLCLARVAAQTQTAQLSLASALKTLDLVRQLYEKWGRGIEVADLLAVCDIRDRLSHRKRLSEVGIKALRDGINWLLESPSNGKGQTAVGGTVALTQLEAYSLEESSSVGLLALKQLHCWSLQLLGVLEQDGETEKNCDSRDMLLNCLLCIYLCKTHLPPSAESEHTLQQYAVQFQAKPPLLKPVSLQNLLQKLSMDQGDLKQEESTANFSRFPSFNEPERVQRKKTSVKKLVVGSGSKQKKRGKKSRQKIKTVGQQLRKQLQQLPSGKGKLRRSKSKQGIRGASQKKLRKG